jgi:DNA anti-recombination protein RmuC
MKGMMGFLEKAGLVRREDGEPATQPEHVDTAELEIDIPPMPKASATAVSVDENASMSLEAIYQQAGVASCAYPAERLMRLIDGLKAMDEPTRLRTIQAIDEADESWTIQDPIKDANAKAEAIRVHSKAIHASLATSEQETQALLMEIRQRQEKSTTEIRQQIAELESLLTREIARGAQETALLESSLQSKKELVNRELANLSRTARELQTLASQFSVNTSN